MQLVALVADRWVSTMLKAIFVLGPLVLVFWVWKPVWLQKFRILQVKAARPRFFQELPRTIMSLSTYMIPVVALAIAKMKFGYSVMYTDIAEYGVPYFIFSLFLFAVIIDTWFYWTHRLMHTNKFWKKVHSVHHLSYNTNPLTSYSFHILEALSNMFPYMLMLFIVPWHPLALYWFGVYGMLHNGYVHLGYDAAYGWRSRNPVLKWIYSSTHHTGHHQLYDHNFGVYFTFWDKLMGTEVHYGQEQPVRVKAKA